jgi:PAS domain S-box-containing protein
MSENLTKIKKLTEEIEKVNTFNQHLIEAINTSHEGIALLDENGNYTWMNKAHETMFGYGEGELIGKSWTIIYSDEDVQWFIENVFPTIDKEGKWSGEATAISRDGVTKVEEMVYLTALPNGGLICTCRNIKDCKNK